MFRSNTDFQCLYSISSDSSNINFKMLKPNEFLQKRKFQGECLFHLDSNKKALDFMKLTSYTIANKVISSRIVTFY